MHRFPKKFRRLYDRAFLEKHGPLKDVPQFANVPGPVIFHELYQFAFRNLKTVPCNALEQVGTQRGDVTPSVPERREVDVDHAQVGNTGPFERTCRA